MPSRFDATPIALERVRAAQAEDRVLLMGIINTTPDSFFEGGRASSDSSAEERVRVLVAEGADIIDIGGESSRPRHTPVDAAEQMRRLGTALECALRFSSVTQTPASSVDEPPSPLVSVDTAEPEVARFALQRGAHLINDVSCLADPELARVVAESRAVLVLTHSRGLASQRAGRWLDSDYTDIVSDVSAEWLEARDRAGRQGLGPERIWFDPGIGFAKNARHNYEILHRLEEFLALGAPILVGPSRKSFIAAVCEANVEARLPGTIAACVHAAGAGAAVLRVHDVAEINQALRVSCAIRHPGKLLSEADVERRHRVSPAGLARPTRS